MLKAGKYIRAVCYVSPMPSINPDDTFLTNRGCYTITIQARIHVLKV